MYNLIIINTLKIKITIGCAIQLVYFVSNLFKSSYSYSTKPSSPSPSISKSSLVNTFKIFALIFIFYSSSKKPFSLSLLFAFESLSLVSLDIGFGSFGTFSPHGVQISSPSFLGFGS